MELTQLEVSFKSLRSQVVKEFVGERLVDVYATLTQEDGQDGNGGIIGKVLGIAVRLTGFLINVALGAVGWVLRNIWDFLVEAYMELKTFDFNQMDSEINRQIDQNWRQIYGAAGRLAGNGLISVGSVLIAGAIAYKYPIVAGQVAIKLAEEAGDELRAEVVSFLTTSRNVLARNAILGIFLTTRKYRLFGQEPITARRDPWIMSEKWEEWIHKQFKNENVRAFVDNFLETVEDRIIETGYVISYALDDIYGAQKLANRSALGKERVIEIQPDPDNEKETLVISGKQQLVMPAVQNAMLSHKVVRNREVGQLVGMPLADYVKANPHVRKLSIIFRSVEKPPFREPNGKRARIVTYNIPDAKQGLTWQELKTACQPFTWGKFRCTANLTNGRQMAVYGSTGNEAEQTLRRLLTLSNADILTLSVTEEKDRNARLRKEATQVYPAFATLLTRRTDPDDPQYVDLEGKGYAEFTTRVELYHDSEPEDSPVLR